MSFLSRFSTKATALAAGLLIAFASFTMFTPVSRAATVEELQALIAQLMAQIAALSNAPVASPAPIQFTQDLTIGSTGADVVALQNWLIAQGYVIAPGATGLFDSYTRDALARWQAANGLVPAVGYFGPMTRAKVNALIPQGSVTPVPGGKLTLTAPNNGEKWQIGDTHTVLWAPYDMSNKSRPVNPAGDVVAYLEKLDKGRYVSLGKLMDCGKASIHTDLALEKCGTGKYAEPGEYYINIVNNKTGESDRSDKPVTFVARGTLKVDAKVDGSNGPITVSEKGSRHQVSWSSNAETCTITAMTEPFRFSTIENLPGSGARALTLYPSSDGYSSWVDVRCRSTVAMEGSAYDSVEVSANAASESITIASPNGGEVLNPSDRNVVSWNASANLSKVSIALYKNDATYKWIVRDLPLGKDSYVIPSSFFNGVEAGNNYKIYIIGYKTNGGTVEDKSDRSFSIRSAEVQEEPKAPTSSLDVAPGTETKSRAKAIFADWQKNPGSYTETTPRALSSGSPVHTVLRLGRNCSDHSIVSKHAILVQDGGYSNYTGGSRYQEQCINDGSFDSYYDEAKVDGASGEVISMDAPVASQMAGVLEALRSALGALSGASR